MPKNKKKIKKLKKSEADLALPTGDRIDTKGSCKDPLYAPVGKKQRDTKYSVLSLDGQTDTQMDNVELYYY